MRYSLEIMSEIPFEIIAPQHGSIICDMRAAAKVFKILAELKHVGIDHFFKDKSHEDPANIDSLIKRVGM